MNCLIFVKKVEKNSRRNSRCLDIVLNWILNTYRILFIPEF